MRPTILIALVTVIAALSAAAIGVATAGRTTESVQRYDHLSNSGVPVFVSERNADILRGGGGEPVLNRLGTRAGVTFNVGRGKVNGHIGWLLAQRNAERDAQRDAERSGNDSD